ncbi:uncharacterized protein BO95DRAFT_47403 [Aspergillus brunneoviolaceus CBS 621.78]|uniref:Uncharacterized protein n=1 Tax=Aspergillus brunneoviolaceus CBS 621.78 TaxID=1450534 RepID=A0ACD1FRL4_9EURO|nr:hypothetical protein BO95DRAFT_47403 [Aspergillus brunneoviolaceus CBS 621.78]RAH39602.1 hypothetical protein BO95DRAFT_47403 [Aspergillus brunneoviolaceus CBS 621.78]
MIGKASERFLVGLLQEISSRVEAYSWPWPASQHLGMKARGRVGSGARERGVGTQPPLDRERVPQTWLSLDKKLKNLQEDPARFLQACSHGSIYTFTGLAATERVGTLHFRITSSGSSRLSAAVQLHHLLSVDDLSTWNASFSHHISSLLYPPPSETTTYFIPKSVTERASRCFGKRRPLTVLSVVPLPARRSEAPPVMSAGVEHSEKHFEKECPWDGQGHGIGRGEWRATSKAPIFSPWVTFFGSSVKGSERSTARCRMQYADS